jgi:glycyl-tRNA synthetase beta subunit
MDLVKLYEPIRRTERSCPQLADAMKKNLELQKRRDALLLQIRIAPEEQQAKLIEELRSVVSQRFDVILSEKQFQYDSIRKRLDDLASKVEAQAKELETLNKNKEQSVKDRMDELLERTEKVDWN